MYNRLRDIPKFPFSSYRVNVGWKYLHHWLDDHNEGILRLDLDPFFQRGYVWTLEQKIAYIEYRLRGGFSGKDIFWNCPTWMNFDSEENIVTLVDGKQRLNAVLEFLDNQVPAFGKVYSEYEDELVGMEPDFIFHINNLVNPVNVVEWYVGINTGGSIHTEEDLKPALDYLKQLPF